MEINKVVLGSEVCGCVPGSGTGAGFSQGISTTSKGVQMFQADKNGLGSRKIISVGRNENLFIHWHRKKSKKKKVWYLCVSCNIRVNN